MCRPFKLFLFRVAAIPAQCTSQRYNVLKESSRYWKNATNTTYCDTDTIVSNQWYRFTGEAGTMMAAYCIPKSSCSTHRTGWINGTHPSAAYMTVSRTVCMHWSSKCCEKNYPVEITNCDGYYVYKLKRPTFCAERYCGVKGKVACVMCCTVVQ